MEMDRIKHLLFRLDDFGDKLINEGEYYKKTVKELKAELKKEKMG
ncbi:MAG: hypothetical protein WC821_04650 [archaeon]|jgi:hypothetical protein